MQKLIVCLLFVSLISLPLMAQKVEVFGGYQYLRIGNNTSGLGNAQGFNGFDASATYNFISGIFGVEGDLAGTYTTISGVSSHLYTYSGGPVVSFGVGKIKPFVHALGGLNKLTGTSGATVTWSGYTTMAGGGLDFKLNRFVAVRLAQFDWVYYHFGSKTVGTSTLPAFSGNNNFRVATGIVFRL